MVDGLLDYIYPAATAEIIVAVVHHKAVVTMVLSLTPASDSNEKNDTKVAASFRKDINEVRHIAARVSDEDQSPASVADQFGTSLSAVYEALAYNYDHIETMREYEGANEAAFETVRETSVKPNKTIQ